MFIGKYQATLDPKGRLSVPARFRETLNAKASTQLVITFFEECLVAYPTDEWQEVVRKARELPTGQRDVRNFLRMFYANAADCQLDRQGRVLIPEHLRGGAGLEKEVLIVGLGPKFEIWGRALWEQNVESAKDRMVEIAESAGIGF